MLLFTQLFVGNWAGTVPVLSHTAFQQFICSWLSVALWLGRDLTIWQGRKAPLTSKDQVGDCCLGKPKLLNQSTRTVRVFEFIDFVNRDQSTFIALKLCCHWPSKIKPWKSQKQHAMDKQESFCPSLCTTQLRLPRWKEPKRRTHTVLKVEKAAVFLILLPNHPPLVACPTPVWIPRCPLRAELHPQHANNWTPLLCAAQYTHRQKA